MESDTHNDTIRCDKATSSTLIYSSNQIGSSKSLARSGDMTSGSGSLFTQTYRWKYLPYFMHKSINAVD